MRKPLQTFCLLVCVAMVCSTVTFGQAPVKLNPWASYVDVAARRSQLKHTRNARLRLAISQLQRCESLPVVAPPEGPMRIPPHYLHGSHGPTNPAERAQTEVYARFERRVTAGMNQYLAMGSHEEAACAQYQIDRWAQANTLLDYDAAHDPQSWYQVEWTLSSAAISESVLLNDSKLDSAVTTRDVDWMNRVAHRMIGFPSEGRQLNNLHYWRGLAAIATGVISSDPQLFDFGVNAYKTAVNDIDQRGAFPKEMARHEMAIHYQSFALEPLIPIAAFAERQGVQLYNYKSPSGRSIADAINFLGEALADPSIVKAYTSEAQNINSNAVDFFACFEFYRRQFPHRKLPDSIMDGLKKPTFATRLGGSTTAIAGR